MDFRKLVAVNSCVSDMFVLAVLVAQVSVGSHATNTNWGLTLNQTCPASSRRLAEEPCRYHPIEPINCRQSEHLEEAQRESTPDRPAIARLVETRHPGDR
jgi:hypothetical protein